MLSASISCYQKFHEIIENKKNLIWIFWDDVYNGWLKKVEEILNERIFCIG